MYEYTVRCIKVRLMMYLILDKRTYFMVYITGIAMVVIPSNIVLLSYSHFTLNAWRVFLLLMSIPSLISFILIYRYPESPRYLMLKGHMDQSREVLAQIYSENNKNTTEPYSVSFINIIFFFRFCMF